MRKNIIMGLCLLLSIGSVKSQVTIGSATPPNKGALLDLKDDTATGDATASKGLMLPRVNLTDKDNLYPMFEDDGAGGYKIGTTAYTKTDEDAKHTGLWVYHTDKCTMDGSGGYVWSGKEWTRLGEKSLIGLNLSTYNLKFYNNKDITEDISVSWTSNTPSIAPTYTTNNVDFTISPLSGTFETSPQSVSIKPNKMTTSDLESNYFGKQGTITFSLADSPCAGGGTQTKTIDVDLINKGIKVNGKAYPDQLLITGNTTSTATVQSNAQWKVGIQPTTNAAISNLSQTSGGTETEDISSTPPTTNLNYDVTVGPNKSRYNYLTFSDNYSPKRFNDVVLTVAQCAGTNDLTMLEYKDLWEEMYGLDPLNDEPNSDGDSSKNKNKVQWHYDQDGNIFFSAMFGDERWMTTNLAAITYDSQSPDKQTLYQSFAASSFQAYYAFPNVYVTYDASLSTQYDARQRLGRLYNWTAATGKIYPAKTTPGIQGICPDGWHLPANPEWQNLKTALQITPTQWSGNTIGSNIHETLVDLCEPPVGTGKSFGVLDGGFSALFAGWTQGLNYGEYTMFWSSSPMGGSSSGTYWAIFNTSDTFRGPHPLGTNAFLSVRCKKD